MNAAVVKAREYLGTPFTHQGRLKGVGVDCAGLVILVGRELGLEMPDVEAYSPHPDGHTLEEMLDTNYPVAAEYQEGDVLLFWVYKREYPSHTAIYSGQDRIIHAYGYQGVNRVCENSMGDWWHRRLVKAYRLPWQS